MVRDMDDQRIGRSLRVLRRRRRLRQADVAVAGGVSQSLVSDLESGRLAGVTLGPLRRVFAAVDAGFEGSVLWRGPGLDRLLDADHALLCGIATERLIRDGWDLLVETSYSIRGERGSIDVLGANRTCRCVVVEEVKTSLVSLDSTLRKLDEKVRLVRTELCQQQFGWVPRTVGRLLILPDTTSARRSVARHDALLRVALPDRGSEVRRWLRAPNGDLAGILFLPFAGRSVPDAARQRVHSRS